MTTVVTVACVPDQSAFVPVSPRWDRVLMSGAVHLKRGMFVGLEVSEGGFLVPKGAPAVIYSFPWTTPVVSGNGVLSATRECGHPAEVSSGTIAVYWFQAVATGRNSLMVYWVHVMIVYGSLVLPLKRALSIPQGALATVIVTLMMVAMSALWLAWKSRKAARRATAAG